MFACLKKNIFFFKSEAQIKKKRCRIPSFFTSLRKTCQNTASHYKKRESYIRTLEHVPLKCLEVKTHKHNLQNTASHYKKKKKKKKTLH